MITEPVPVSPSDTPKPRRSRQSARSLSRGERPAGREPHGQRCARLVEDRAGRHRGPVPAGGAHDPAITRPPASDAVALGAFEPVWPAQPLQVVQAVGIGAEPGLELAYRAWVVQPATDLSHGLSLLRLNGEPEAVLREEALVHQGCMIHAASTGRSRGARARTARGSGCPLRRGRTRVRSLACQPVTRTPRRRRARRLCESRPAAWRAPGNGASCPSRPAGLLCPSLNTPALGRDPRSRHDHPRQVPLMAEATIACVMCGTIRPRGIDWDAGVAVEGCQKEHERAMHGGGRVSAWKMESGWPGAASEHAPVSTPAARRGYPGRVCGAPAVSTVRSITGPRHTFLASGG